MVYTGRRGLEATPWEGVRDLREGFPRGLRGWWSGKGTERTTTGGKGERPKGASPWGGAAALWLPSIEPPIPERR